MSEISDLRISYNKTSKMPNSDAQGVFGHDNKYKLSPFQVLKALGPRVFELVNVIIHSSYHQHNLDIPAFLLMNNNHYPLYNLRIYL